MLYLFIYLYIQIHAHTDNVNVYAYNTHTCSHKMLPRMHIILHTPKAQQMCPLEDKPILWCFVMIFLTAVLLNSLPSKWSKNGSKWKIWQENLTVVSGYLDLWIFGAFWSISYCSESAAPCTIIMGWRILVAVLRLRFSHLLVTLSASRCHRRPAWFTSMSRCFDVVFWCYSYLTMPKWGVFHLWGMIKKQHRIRATKSINASNNCF